MFLASILLLASAQQPAPSTPAIASGTFDVTVAPQAGAEGPIGVLALAKTYQGDLSAKADGRMLGGGAPDGGTASYVALEQVTGTLRGRKGSFMLQHSGWMHAGKQVMTVAIAPGSGTGGLAGIGGTMTITIEGKMHRYQLRYTLPE